MLTVANLTFSYGSVRALSDVSFTAAPGRITCVMGRNGVGKTTLMRSIMGQLAAKGTVRLGDQDLSRLPAYHRARQGIALVPQGREIFPRLSVRANLEVAFAARGSIEPSAIDEVMDMFPILRQFAKRNGGDLSGGQQQQLAIARALIGKPRVLLLDEPTEGIQPNIIQEIGRVLQRLAAGGMAVVLVEQYLDFVREIGHDFVILNRGQLAASGVVQDLSDAVVAEHLRV
jgi:urea transport system ATP-binding protein